MGDSSKNSATDTSSALVEALDQGMAFKEVKGLSDDTLEMVYSTAFNMYQAGKWQKAETLFKFLCFYDHYNSKYFLGLAACQQSQKDFEAAISTYSYVAILDGEDPRAPLQAANCHLAMSNFKEAAAGYHAAQLFGRKKPEHAGLVKFAQVREEAMKVKLKAKKNPVNKRNK